MSAVQLPRNRRLFEAVGYLVSLSIVAVIGLFILWLARRVWIDTTPFDTDEADHANAALELYTWLTRGNPVASARAVIRQAFYPPVHSFFVTLSYLIFGPSFAASRIPSVLLFALTTFLLLISCYRTATTLKAPSVIALTSASLFALLLASSPITIANSVLCMLELSGLMLLTLTLAMAARLPQGAWPDRRVLSLFAILVALIFLAKYSFGIFVIPAIFATLLFAPLKDAGIFRRLADCALIAGLLALILGCWTALTDRAAMFHFFVGHKSYAPLLSSENLFFELRSWFSSYCVDVVAAGWVLTFALVGAIAGWRNFALRFSAFTALATFTILILSTTNEERHFIVALPPILLLSCNGLLFTLQYACERFRQRQGLTLAIIAGLAVMVMLSWSREIDDLSEKVGIYFEGDPQYSQLFDFIVDNLDPNLPTIVNGVSDEFGIESLRWALAARTGKAYTETILETYHFRDDKNRTARLRKRNVDAPYRIDGFPKSPFANVLATGYYAKAVQITKLSEKQRFRQQAEEFSAALSTKKMLQRELAEIRVTVFSLKD